MRPHAAPLLAAVEGGGSKFLAAVGHRDATGAFDIVASTRVETTAPEETLGAIASFLAPHAPRAVGVACFGPLELRRDDDAFGSTLRTPKPGWSDVPVARRLADALGVPVEIDTDVNAAALAEQSARRGADPLVYVTVGTGVGVGVAIAGEPLHGLLHPELGHMPLAREPGDDFLGACPFHGACLEGLVSAAALRARLGADPATLADGHPDIARAARYLGVGLAVIVLAYAPAHIVVGGGVASRHGVREQAREAMRDTLAGYVARAALERDLDRYVVAPSFEAPGLMGAFLLAERTQRAR